jgi:hypothetical protein
MPCPVHWPAALAEVAVLWLQLPPAVLAALAEVPELWLQLPPAVLAALAAPWLQLPPEPTSTASTVVAPPGAERVTPSRLLPDAAFVPAPCEWYGQVEADEDIPAWGQPCMAAAEAPLALQAAAISGVHLAAIAAVHVVEEDLDEAAAAEAEALSSHADPMAAHVPRARTADAAKTSRECFITHLQGWERDPGRAPHEKHRPYPPKGCHRQASGVLVKCKKKRFRTHPRAGRAVEVRFRGAANP